MVRQSRNPTGTTRRPQSRGLAPRPKPDVDESVGVLLSAMSTPSKSRMGARAASYPSMVSHGGEPLIGAPSHSLDPSPQQRLLNVMPDQYKLSAGLEERTQHAQLLAKSSVNPDGVHMSWAKGPFEGFLIWLVFPSKRGSLGVVTSILSEFSINISKAAANSTIDGSIAVDSFSVDRQAALAHDSPRICCCCLRPIAPLTPPIHTCSSLTQDGRRVGSSAPEEAGRHLQQLLRHQQQCHRLERAESRRSPWGRLADGEKLGASLGLGSW